MGKPFLYLSWAIYEETCRDRLQTTWLRGSLFKKLSHVQSEHGVRKLANDLWSFSGFRY